MRKLNIDLKSLNQWLLANKISLNATKTELIYFRNKRTPVLETKPKLNGVKLDATDHVKYVGIIFDEHLTFHRHIKIESTFIEIITEKGKNAIIGCIYKHRTMSPS